MTKGFATITPECEEVFDEVKGTDNLNYVIYAASAHDKKVTVAESGKYKDYNEFLSHFKEDSPRYAVVKLTYDSPAGDGQRSKLAFITWVPEGAGIHDKSYYTSNKDHLFYALQDISLHVLAHSQTELAHAAILGKFKAL
ncbi:Actin-binding cofilin/tropomyosin type [Penicillium cf. griseofulvum]|uniref:Cofilin n=1 Tax=Penicillium cf. griseofulvum TaxID=2972120 RepID=A0A9W9MB99_9EURO|nr:Actin-binding cofilin/tropomyosin type [Penicillium cf. griseofulvum]KAJ5445222.1 Actin-binding cofilin/tropomyosin type [Penicillium cf. griseofulvum]KAJ5446945.1 Actin-binding cofilin/tropomyosin type [Penicillium cf. griseofulvum]